MIGFPDGTNRAVDQCALLLPARTTREQIPDAATEIRPTEQHIRVERDHQDRRDREHQRWRSAHDRDASPGGAASGTVRRIWLYISQLTITARNR